MQTDKFPVSIAILGTRGIPARYGGFETFAERLSIGLVEKGWSVEVYCEDDGTDRPDTYHGVTLKTVAVPRLGPLSTIVFDILCLWKARHASVVYMLGYGASLFCFVPRLFGKQVWINMDGLEWKRSKFNWAGRTYLRIMEAIATKVANRLVADAEGIRAYLEQTYRKLPQVDVIPYGSDVITAGEPELLDEWSLSPDGYYLVVARLEPENHVLEAIEGYCLSGAKEPLIVLGNDKVATEYVARLKQAASKGNVHFLGAIHDNRKLSTLRYYSKAYIHGHSVGGTNPSLLEAMGCRNLILAHDNVFNREVTDNNAYFFGPPQQLAEIIRQIDHQGSKISQMRQAVFERVKSQYSWQRIVDIYDNLLARFARKA